MSDQHMLNSRLQQAVSGIYVDDKKVRALLNDKADPKCVRLQSLIGRDYRSQENALIALEMLLVAGADPNQDHGKVIEKALGLSGRDCTADYDALELLLKHNGKISGSHLGQVIVNGNISLVKKLAERGAKFSECHAVFSTIIGRGKSDMLNFCLDQIQHELKEQKFNAYCKQKLREWMGRAAHHDRADLMETLVNRFNIAPLATDFRIAATEGSLKVMDYLLSLGCSASNNGLLAEVVEKATGTDENDVDQIYASVLSRLLGIEGIDRTVSSISLERLTIQGHLCSLTVLATHGIASQAMLEECRENRRVADRVSQIADMYRFNPTDDREFPNILFNTRENGDICECRYGQEDIDRAKSLADAIKSEFPGLEIQILTCDEWVMLAVTKQSLRQVPDESETGMRLG